MSSTELSGSPRVQSVDILRGAVMILMAIDHVRVYAGVPAGGPEPAIFFTRWVTHFCAPCFVFFAGTSAFLYGKKTGDMKVLMRYLVSRGLLLVALEFILIRFFWSFNVSTEFILAGVIWMLGWCMVLLGLFVQLRPVTIGVIGLVIIFFQQVFGLVPSLLPESMRSWWEFIYTSGSESPFGISILYVIVPWIGVMMAGYGFGAILLMEPGKRNKLCLRIGLSAIALYLIAGSILIITQPSADAPPFMFRLLGQKKYPASQLFLLMTLGPAIALVPLAEKARGWFAEVLKVFGRVPFFYYMLHIPVIHVSALLVNLIVSGASLQELYVTAPYVWFPDEARWGLPLLYLVFVIDVAILFVASRWYMRYKAAHPGNVWLKYL